MEGGYIMIIELLLSIILIKLIVGLSVAITLFIQGELQNKYKNLMDKQYNELKNKVLLMELLQSNK